jgi:hypothetical protein
MVGNTAYMKNEAIARPSERVRSFCLSSRNFQALPVNIYMFIHVSYMLKLIITKVK